MGSSQQMLFAEKATAAGWAFRSVGAVGSGANPTIPLPAGHTAGDLLVIAICSSVTSITSPAGWSVSVNNTSGLKFAVFYKIDSGSESAVAITGGSTTCQGVMLAYIGINATPLDVNGTITSTLTTASLTTTAVNDLVVSVFADSVAADTWTGIPASTTVRYNGGGLTGLDALLVVDELKTTAGATTTRTATATTSTSPKTMACSFKI